MRKILTAIGAAGVLLIASAASATSITVSSTDGTWSNMVGAPPNFNNATTPRTARWGTDLGSGLSGYDYTPRTTPFNATIDGGPFFLGTFVHQNFPIAAPAITSIDLDFLLAWSGGFTPVINGKFLFTHFETPNGDDPCADGGANGVGVNVNGCADIVTVTSPFLNTLITNGVDTYFFTLLGFSTDGGLTTSSQFKTVETLRNTALLYGTLTSQPIGGMPEPASLILFGTGLMAVAARRRYTRRP